MTSIFPPSEAGGLIIRDPDTGAYIPQPEVENASFPAQLSINCDLTALPSNCPARVTPEQINAIVSELINFYVAMDPTREWDCSEQDNLAEAFEQFVQDLVSGAVGDVTCNVTIGNAAQENAYLLYCDGLTLKKWSLHDAGGMFDIILDNMCDVTESDIADSDYILYCRNGVVGKGLAGNYNIYTGQWQQARAYKTTNMVQYEKKLYSPNVAIPAGTAFAVGTVGQTWYEVSATLFPTYNPANAYSKNTIINHNGRFYAANEDIPANTPFVVGTAGATWREIDFNNISILDFNPAASYKRYNVVIQDGVLFRAKNDVGPGALNDANWEQIGGERSRYRGHWVLASIYRAEDLVENNGRLYTANSNIAAGTAFSVGTGANKWTEVSPSLGIAYDSTQTYKIDDIVSDGGNFYIANGAIPTNTPPASNVGITGATWRMFSVKPVIRDFSTTTNYAAGEMVLRATNAYPNEKGILQAPNGANAGGFDPVFWKEIANRNKFRGRWIINDAYLQGDIVLRYGVSDPYGTLFEANNDMPINTPWNVGAGLNQWTKLTSAPTNVGIQLKQYNQANAYVPGDYVLTPWGIYAAEGNVPAGQPFFDANGAFTPFNSGRSPIITMSAAFNTHVRNHRNALLKFDFVGAKQYVLVTNTFKVGDTVSGYSINGQLTVAGAGGVTIRSPDGGTLRNKDYASFLIRCIGAPNQNNAEFLLSGDLQTLP